MIKDHVASTERSEMDQQVPQRTFYRLTTLLVIIGISLLTLSFLKPKATHVDHMPAQIFVDGEIREVHLGDVHDGATVRDALRWANVRMGPDDRVVPVRETPLSEGMRIEVIRVWYESIEEAEQIPFATVRWADPELPAGETRLVRDGQEGLIEQTYDVTYENGNVVSRRLVSTHVIEEPIDEIIRVGALESMPVLSTDTGDYYYIEVKEMIATAYTPGEESTGQWADGYTFTGLRAGYGVVAVDPEVIPLGTMLYVPGYGEAVAADIGGAIKGDRIDLGFETVEEALRFGRKPVQVYVLAP